MAVPESLGRVDLIHGFTHFVVWLDICHQCLNDLVAKRRHALGQLILHRHCNLHTQWAVGLSPATICRLISLPWQFSTVDSHRKVIMCMCMHMHPNRHRRTDTQTDFLVQTLFCWATRSREEDGVNIQA
jgi:hypothetical protein